MHRYHFLIIFILLFTSGYLFSQQVPKNHDPEQGLNSIDISLGGNGLFLSANYHRMVRIRAKSFMDLSAGIGFTPFSAGITLPHQVTLNFGTQSSFLEVGLGGSYWTGKTDASGYEESTYSYQLSPIIGWRKHFKRPLVLRIYASPLFHISGAYFYEDYAVVPYGGVSFGYRF